MLKTVLKNFVCAPLPHCLFLHLKLIIIFNLEIAKVLSEYKKVEKVITIISIKYTFVFKKCLNTNCRTSA